MWQNEAVQAQTSTQKRQTWLLQRICSYKMVGCDPLREPETCIVLEQTIAKAKNRAKCCFKMAKFW